MSLHPKLEHFEKDEDDDEGEDEDYVPEVDHVEDKAEISVAKKEIRTRTKVYEVAEANEEVEPIKPEEKKKADDLWSDFISDVKAPEKPTQPLKQAASNVITQTKSSGDLKKSEALVLTKSEGRRSLDLFGGATVTDSATANSTPIPKSSRSVVSKTEPRSFKVNDRLTSILSKINKEPKISTLQKSLMDWNEFKQSENIEEELDIQNRGKNSYLERKAFLERTDHREFEIERDLRNKKMKKS